MRSADTEADIIDEHWHCKDPLSAGHTQQGKRLSGFETGKTLRTLSQRWRHSQIGDGRPSMSVRWPCDAWKIWKDEEKQCTESQTMSFKGVVLHSFREVISTEKF